MTNRHLGSGIDALLQEEGVVGAFQALAIKDVIALQLAVRMRSSWIRVARVLDPADLNLPLETPQRAAAVLGRKVQIGGRSSKSWTCLSDRPSGSLPCAARNPV